MIMMYFLNISMFRQVNTTSVLTWWSSSPQMFLDTLTFDNKTLTMRAFQNKDLVIGNPEVTMIFKYCQVCMQVYVVQCTVPEKLVDDLQLLSVHS
jgi:hypothetical protein